jgi:uncharacterized protein (DUF1697 family)
MATFVAFLRGINVGDHILVKKELQAAVEKLGFTEMSAFKQSGNLIFKAETEDAQTVETQIHDDLTAAVGYDIAVFVRTISQLQALIKSDPFRSVQPKKPEESFQVTFLPTYISFPQPLPKRIPKSTADIIGTDYREVFSVTRGHGDGGKPNPYIERTLKTQATTRNWNTILRIATKYRT